MKPQKQSGVLIHTSICFFSSFAKTYDEETDISVASMSRYTILA